MQEYVSKWLSRWDLSNTGWNLILIGLSLVFGLLIMLALSVFTRKKVEDITRYSLIRSLIQHLRKPMSVFLPLFFFNALLPAMRLDEILIHKIGKAVQVATIITVAWILIQIIEVLKDWVLHRYDDSKENNLHERKIRTQLQYVRRVLLVLIVSVATAMVLLSFENLRALGTGLLTGVGLGGVVIGFAAQRSLGNFLAGFQIAFTQPFRIDDVLIVEGEFGKVDEITLTYVVMKLWDERRLILPINYFIEKPFQNWSRTGTNLLGTVEVFADYSMLIDDVRAELTRLVKSTPKWDGRAVALEVTNATEKTITLRALVSANNSGNLWDLKCFVREHLIKFINQHYPDKLPKTRTEITGIINQSQPS